MNSQEEQAQQFLNERMPSHLQHNNAKYFASDHNPEIDSAHDYAVVEGVRQALMGGVMSNDELNRLIMDGAITPKQAFLIGDIHNFEPPSGVDYNDPRVQAVYEEGRAQRILRQEQLGLE